VDVHIGKLRRKIDAPGGIPLLYNVRGNLEIMPADPPPDGAVHVIRIKPPAFDDGSYLVIGRSSQEVERLQELGARALKLGLPPTVILSLVSESAAAGIPWDCPARFVKNPIRAVPDRAKGNVSDTKPPDPVDTGSGFG
jgi:hypothetical protein